MKIGFIGNGNMGGAIIEGILKNNIAAPDNIIVSDINQESLKVSAQKYGIVTYTDNKKACSESDILILAVKPNVIYDVIEDIKHEIKNDQIIISIAAGQSIDKISSAFGKELKIIRVMPNTPALVGEGMSGIAANENVNSDDLDLVLKIFNSFGVGEIIDEKLMDAVTAVSGSSPAYIFMLIEAMADAAVQEGMPRSKAYTFAAQAVLGSAKMVLETGKHPGELKDMVCSPGGTTIDAVTVLEKNGFRSAVMEAMKACFEKSKSL